MIFEEGSPLSEVVLTDFVIVLQQIQIFIKFHCILIYGLLYINFLLYRLIHHSSLQIYWEATKQSLLFSDFRLSKGAMLKELNV